MVNKQRGCGREGQETQKGKKLDSAERTEVARQSNCEAQTVENENKKQEIGIEVAIQKGTREGAKVDSTLTGGRGELFLHTTFHSDVQLL